MYYVILIIVAVIVAFYLAWILLALLLRVFSFVVFYWVVGFSLMFVGGLLFSITIPWRVLSKRGRFDFRQLTPDDVVRGTAFKRGPRGENRHWGWDNAWPNYLPYQAVQDAKGVVGETRLIVGGMWESISFKIRFGHWTGGGVKKIAAQAAGVAPRLFWIALLPVPFFGFWCGVWLSVGAWMLAMVVLGAVIGTGQWLVLLVLRWSDILRRRRMNAELRCPHCYYRGTTPSYRCSDAGCPVIHRNMLPGPLGLTTRRCVCGTQLPNTIRSASRKLKTVCPRCDHDLAGGSGLRHTVQLPVIGSVGAGKTRLLMAAVVQLKGRLTQRGGSLEGLTPAAESYVAQAEELMSKHADTNKTPDVAPEGVPLVLSNQAGRVTELQLMDAAGEAFATWDKTADLRYLDDASAFLFVLDPLAWPQFKRELRLQGLASSVLVTNEDQQNSYSSAVDRMRSENVSLGRRSLGVILSKADILMRLPSAAALRNGPNGTSEVRTWMLDHDFDLLITGMEMDFGSVHYFLSDSMGNRDLDDPLNPLLPLQWALEVSKSQLALVDPPDSAAAA